MSSAVGVGRDAPVADLDRRFQAFVVDRLVAWSAYAGVAVLVWQLDLGLWAAVGLGVAVLLLVGVLLALPLGLRGTSPGRALTGLRVVDAQTGAPIGVGRALLRQLLLGAATLPMLGLGTATLAWTAAADPGRERRGWHDLKARSLVVDVRPRPVDEVAEDPRPRHVVNLTAMRLRPAPEPAPEVAKPAPMPLPSSAETRVSGATPAPVRPAAPPQVPAAQPAAPPVRATPPAAAAPTVVPAAPAPAAAPPAAPLPPPPAAAPVPPVAPVAPVLPTPSAAPTPPAAPVAPAVPAPGRRAARPATSVAWRVSVDSGETWEVDGLSLVGRDPQPRPGEQARHLVPLRSADMSISKTHVQLHVAPDGALVVTDRGSTNGSVLLRQGMARDLAPGRPATLLDGDRIAVGDREIRVSREVR